MHRIDTQDEPRLRLAILGCTGSIGRQTLDIVRAFPHHFEVVALAARTYSPVFREQVREFQPTFIVCTEEQQLLNTDKTEQKTCILYGEEGLLIISTHPEVDMVVVATSGLIGLTPTLAAIEAGKQIALANKETLVMAGHLVMAAAREARIVIRPIDSEHSAIWQCLRGEHTSEIRRLILTASGGPFLHTPREKMGHVNIEQALSHPTWKMGAKVTIDSATLMNKGLEAIEAHWLFAISYEKIEVLIHPQSIIHSMVEFVDHSVKLQASTPSMHLPIQDALSYPQRLDCTGTELASPLSWPEIQHLDFLAVDDERFPCLSLAFHAGQAGGTAPAVLVAADEQAVDLYLQGKLQFLEIASLVEDVLARHTISANPDLETIQHTVQWARLEVKKQYKSRSKKMVVSNF